MDEREWFERVYRQNAGLLYRVGRRLLSPEQDEDALYDILQDVFLALWDGRRELMAHPNVGGWLMQALKFRVSNARSKQLRRNLRAAYSLDEDDAPAVAAGGETPEELAALAQYMQALCDLLGEDNARLFLAHALQRRTVHELAAERGVSDSCVAMRLFRLRRQIRLHPEIFFSILMIALHFRSLTI